MAAARSLATGAGSATLEEARGAAIELFRAICRHMPDMFQVYNLEGMTTVRELRSKVANEFRKHAKVTNPKVVDLLVFKGEEELNNYLIHAKQRHHIISQFIAGASSSILSAPPLPGAAGQSEFLRKFYESNNF